MVPVGFYALRNYPAVLRRIPYRDPLTGKKLVFLTNHFTVPALTIARLYRSRWQVEDGRSQMQNPEDWRQGKGTAGRAEGRLPSGSALGVGQGKSSGWRGRFYQLTTITDWSVTD